MSETLKFGNGQWATKVGSTLAYNDEGGNFKPLPFNFTRSTGATRVNKEGLIEVVTNNKPRIDFLNDSKGALLLEPNRSNSFSYSEPIANVGAASGISYESFIWTLGFTNCVKLGDNSAVRFRYGGSVLASTQYTISAFVIMDDLSEPLVGNSSSVGDFSFVVGGIVGGVVNSNVHYGNNIYRVSTTITSGSNLSNNGVIKYTTQSSKGFRITGFQLEQGSYATSYIPTQGSVVTRVAETNVNYFGTSILNGIDGTFFIDMNEFNAGNYGSSAISLGLRNTTSGDFLGFVSEPTLGKLRGRVVDAVGGTSAVGSSFVSVARNKIALTYNSTTIKLFINGVKITELAHVQTAVYNSILLPNTGRSGLFPLNNLKLYNTALTDAELQALTS